jgi:phage-related protein
VDAFGTYFSTMSDVGLNLIKGLWQGISDAAGWLRNQISGFFGGVVQNIKDFFGIASPSKLFADLGGFMADGLGIGFGREMQGVARDMQRAIPTDFNLGANINGAYSLASAPAQGNTGYKGASNGGIANHFYISGLTVREEADIDKIAGALYRKQQQAQRGRGVAFA